MKNKIKLKAGGFFIKRSKLYLLKNDELHYDSVKNNPQIFNISLDENKVNDMNYIDRLMNFLLKKEWISVRIYDKTLNHIVAFLDLSNLKLIENFSDFMNENFHEDLPKVTYIYDHYGDNISYKFNTIDVANYKLFQLYTALNKRNITY